MTNQKCSIQAPRGSLDSSRTKTQIHIAYIGGGSREWAVKLMADLALSPRIGGKLTLFDIDVEAAEHNRCLGEQVFAHPEALTDFRVEVATSLNQALHGADFVIISIEPGPIGHRSADLEIPARYGILQTVGDTTGPGGVLRALRCVPIYRRLASAIMEHAPHAHVINYTNPMAVCTGALFKAEPDIRAFGCCHEVFGTQAMLSRLVSQHYSVAEPARHEISLDLSGVNHFTFASGARWQDNDLMPLLEARIAEEVFFADRSAEARLAREAGNWFKSAGLVAHDFLRWFGALGAAGDRHLVEFVPWYLTSEENLHRWGVIATPFSYRRDRASSPRPDIQSLVRQGLNPSGEEGVAQIEALVGHSPLRTNINLPNRGQAPDLPTGAVVETYALFERGLISPETASPLPSGLAGLVAKTAADQLLLLDAAFDEDADAAFQVLLGHPLVHISTDSAWRMFSEMIEAISYPRRPASNLLRQAKAAGGVCS